MTIIRIILDAYYALTWKLRHIIKTGVLKGSGLEVLVVMHRKNRSFCNGLVKVDNVIYHVTDATTMSRLIRARDIDEAALIVMDHAVRV